MSDISILCLYWPNKNVTVLVDTDTCLSKSASKRQAKRQAKRAFDNLHEGHEEFKDCMILPWNRLFNTKREALDWNKKGK